MQGVDAHTADANACRAHHVYSLHEGNRAVIDRQIAQWRPVSPAVLPEQCKVIQCPYGKSKAHIVLAPIFTFEECQKVSMPTACQRESVLGGQLLVSSQLGQGSSAQTLALGWRPQHSDTHAAPDGILPAAAGMPNGSCGDMHNAGASACDPGPCAQVGEVSSPATAPDAAGTLEDEQPQDEQAPIRGPAPPAEEPAVEKQSRTDGPAEHQPLISIPTKPSPRDPRLRPRKGPTAAEAASRGVPVDEDVICLISDSEDEHAPAAGTSGKAAHPPQRPCKEVPSVAMGPITPEQPVQAEPASRISRGQLMAQPVSAAGLLSVSDAAIRAGCSGGNAVVPPAKKKRRTAGKISAVGKNAAAAVAHDSAGAHEGAVTERGQKKRRKRRAQADDADSVDAQLVNQTSGPGQLEGDPVAMQQGEQHRTGRSRQQRLSFPVQRRPAKQGGGAHGKGSPQQAPCNQQASATTEGAADRFVPASAESPGTGEHQRGNHIAAADHSRITLTML